MKILVGSANPVKVNAVLKAFIECFPEQQWEASGVKVNSGVSDQPMSDKETFTGAAQRVEGMSDHSSDFYVGIEGGLETFQDRLQAFAWVYIKSGEQVAYARTSTFLLPPKVAELVQQGKELGEADDIVFGTSNSKQKMGAVGLLSKGLTNRTSYYQDAVQMALIPFMNHKLY